MSDDTDGLPADPEHRDAEAPPGWARAVPLVGWIGLAVLAAGLVFTSTVALIQWRRADDLRHTERVRRAAASTAGQFGAALFTYDYTDLQAAKARVLGLASPRFATQYNA